MTQAEALTIELGVINRVLNLLRQSTGKCDAIEVFEAEQAMLRFRIKQAATADIGAPG